jgi:hypothetical protein
MANNKPGCGEHGRAGSAVPRLLRPVEALSGGNQGLHHRKHPPRTGGRCTGWPSARLQIDEAEIAPRDPPLMYGRIERQAGPIEEPPDEAGRVRPYRRSRARKARPQGRTRHSGR